jgi:hypothetical protein
MIKILIACTLLLASAGYGEKYVQKNDGLIPGLYQIKTGQKIKGFTIALLEVGTLGGGLYYYLGDIEDKETAWQAYQDLPGVVRPRVILDTQ